ncbi:MAG: hypothetical protein ABII10_02190 [Candidatus Paceibacterota bacterium]
MKSEHIRVTGWDEIRKLLWWHLERNRAEKQSVAGTQQGGSKAETK